jgi:transketolase
VRCRLTTGYGPSHQATEDLAMVRGIPGLTIVDPCDARDIEQAEPQIAAHKWLNKSSSRDRAIPAE